MSWRYWFYWICVVGAIGLVAGLAIARGVFNLYEGPQVIFALVFSICSIVAIEFVRLSWAFFLSIIVLLFMTCVALALMWNIN